MENTLNTSLDVIDWKLGTKIVGGNEDLARNLVEMLIDDLPQQEVKMEEAIKSSDNETLSQVVHSLHGATCYCGVPQLRDAIMRLEVAVIKKQDDVPAHYQNFRDAANNLIETVAKSKA
jgi:two-component system, NarL family, sensor histidine kinase BarA